MPRPRKTAAQKAIQAIMDDVEKAGGTPQKPIRMAKKAPPPVVKVRPADPPPMTYADLRLKPVDFGPFGQGVSNLQSWGTDKLMHEGTAAKAAERKPDPDKADRAWVRDAVRPTLPQEKVDENKPEPLFTEINPGTDWKAHYGTTPPEPAVLPGIVPIPNPPEPPVSAFVAGFWATVLVIVMVGCTATIVMTREPPARPLIVQLPQVVEAVDRLRAEQTVTNQRLQYVNQRLDELIQAVFHKGDEIVDAVKHTHYWGK